MTKLKFVIDAVVAVIENVESVDVCIREADINLVLTVDAVRLPETSVFPTILRLLTGSILKFEFASPVIVPTV